VDEFIEHVEAEMERQGISLSELARRAECGRPYLHRVLARTQSPSLEWAEKVAAALGMQFTLEKMS
jgi:DNA-binding phage protein